MYNFLYVCFKISMSHDFLLALPFPPLLGAPWSSLLLLPAEKTEAFPSYSRKRNAQQPSEKHRWLSCRRHSARCPTSLYVLSPEPQGPSPSSHPPSASNWRWCSAKDTTSPSLSFLLREVRMMRMPQDQCFARTKRFTVFVFPLLFSFPKSTACSPTDFLHHFSTFSFCFFWKLHTRSFPLLLA